MINYKPPDGWAGDFIPFFWDGQYHLFYLKDYRDIDAHGEGTPWFHLTTRDFVSFVEHGECLPRGTPQDQDLYVFTGSVLNAEGRFHIFYTGHNPHFQGTGRPVQAIMHAVSGDLYQWAKVPADTFFAPEGYEPGDWRDPFVFWNAAADEFWMLACARLTAGPPHQRGCTALLTSTDLKAWRIQPPFYAPALYGTHECPDLFQINGWWYLIFSEFSDAWLTRYRMARSLAGPWLAPPDDAFDGRAFYAAKTAAGPAHRFLFGWNPTRLGFQDGQPWQWGGNLVVHELVQQADGTLAVSLPETVAAHFSSPQPVVIESGVGPSVIAGDVVRLNTPAAFSCVGAGPLPAAGRLDVTVQFEAATQAFGLLLRTSADFDTGYYLRFEPARSRFVFDAWPRTGDRPHSVELERPLPLTPGVPLTITLYVDHSLCEVYVNNTVALSTRLYDHPSGNWGMFVSQGQAQFSHWRLHTAPS